MPNPFVYVQLHTQDHKRAKDFYAQLFAWELKDQRGARRYTDILVGKGPPGGMMSAAHPNVPSHWLPFVEVKDVDKATGEAESLGGSVIVAPTNVPKKGRYSVITDPTGAALALWTPLRAPKRPAGAKKKA